MSKIYLNTTFGRLTVVALLSNRRCRCICECGNTTTPYLQDVVRGNTKSCGCLRKEKTSKKFRKDLTGQIFHRLTVVEFADNVKGYVRWKCKCECGKYTIVRGSKLISGHTKSCGCYSREKAQQTKRTGHGDITGQYWATLQNGARTRNLVFNVSIEDVWNLFLKQNRKCALSGLELCFAKYDRAIKGSQQTASLDRIDSNIGYVIDNLQWIHKKLNVMKMSLPNQEFIDWCHLISQFNRGDYSDNN